MSRLVVRQGNSQTPDPALAVAELKAAIDQPQLQAVIFFCSSSYDLTALGKCLKQAFACPVIGCTSSGQISATGFQLGGISALSLGSDQLTVTAHLVANLAESQRCAHEVAETVRVGRSKLADGWRSFGLVLIDGLSMAEERLMAGLYQSLGDLPIVGGSAGDDLKFERTAVYWDGAFHSGIGVLAVFDTPLPFSTFKLQHFRPSDRKLVITAANPIERRVIEINGMSAVEAYAEALGLLPAQFTPAVYSKHPVMLKIGNDYYVRSIAKLNPDQSITFLCAIEEGLVLSIGDAVDPLKTLASCFALATQKVGRPAVVLGCDCILRRLEFEGSGLTRQIGDFFAGQKVFGFSTYGEQFNGLHINQTFTGIALGE